MWSMIPAAVLVLAQGTQPGTESKTGQWCFEREQQGAQLCEETEAACNKLRAINTEIARSPCRRVEPPESRSRRQSLRRHRTLKNRRRRNDKARYPGHLLPRRSASFVVGYKFLLIRPKRKKAPSQRPRRSVRMRWNTEAVIPADGSQRL
jgi:hypothetical protein